MSTPDDHVEIMRQQLLVSQAQLAAQQQAIATETKKRSARLRVMKKSQALGLILTMLFGPLGLFYSAPLAAAALWAARSEIPW